MAQHTKLGKEGEQLAANHLRKSGYKIIRQNWRHERLEVDIICKNPAADRLVFVEVKTRKTDFFGNAEEFISKGQQKRVIMAADAYVREHEIDLEPRFDAIGIVLNQRTQDLRHIEDAFWPAP